MWESRVDTRYDMKTDISYYGQQYRITKDGGLSGANLGLNFYCGSKQGQEKCIFCPFLAFEGSKVSRVYAVAREMKSIFHQLYKLHFDVYLNQNSL